MDAAARESRQEGIMNRQMERTVSAKTGIGLVAIVAGTLAASTITLFSTTASAIDINGIVSTAIAMNYARLHARFAGSSGSHAVRRDRDAEEDGDDSGGGNRKSADSPAHRSTAPLRRTMETSSSNPADQMTSLSRSRD
jgi:hypothetical protein